MTDKPRHRHLRAPHGYLPNWVLVLLAAFAAKVAAETGAHVHASLYEAAPDAGLGFNTAICVAPRPIRAFIWVAARSIWPLPGTKSRRSSRCGSM